MTTGYKVAKTAFKRPPPLPYLVFLDSSDRNGADMKNLKVEHSLTVEYYSETDEYCAELESLLDSVPLKFKQDQQWIESEKCYMTTYDFNIIEREVL